MQNESSNSSAVLREKNNNSCQTKNRYVSQHKMYNEKEKNVTANITKAKVVSVNFRMMQNIHVNVRKTTQIVFLMLLLQHFVGQNVKLLW